jgi:hypothetical protein
MRTRHPTKLLIEKYRAAGYTSIFPAISVRFVKSFIHEMPEEWESLSRESLIRKVRYHCEFAAAAGQLKRTRQDGCVGYVYVIL